MIVPMKGLTAAVFLLSAAGPTMAAVHAHETPKVTPPPGECVTNAAKYSVSTALQKSASKQFRDVAGTAISFDQGAAGCAEVDFSSEAATNPGQILVTQVVLDGSTVC